MRARLIIPLALGILAMAVAAQALAADGPPTQTAPADGTAFTAGDAIVFHAQVGITIAPNTVPPNMLFFISRQTDPIASPIDQLQSGGPGGDATIATYSASPTDDKAWPQKPDTYHWEAVYQDCTAVGATPPNCYVPSGTPQAFTINPKPASAVNSPDDLNTFFDDHPKHRTHHRKVSFAFSSNVQGASFQCFYANGWAKCKSPHVFHHLSPGRYKFKVRSKVNGVEDKTPASFVFRILG
jgi:hypothetical protein